MVYLCIDIVVILYPPIASRRVQMLVSGSFHIFGNTKHLFRINQTQNILDLNIINNKFYFNIDLVFILVV